MYFNSSKYLFIYGLQKYRKWKTLTYFLVVIAIFYFVLRYSFSVLENEDVSDDNEFIANKDEKNESFIARKGISTKSNTVKTSPDFTSSDSTTSGQVNIYEENRTLMNEWRDIYNNQLEAIFFCISRKFSQTKDKFLKVDLCNRNSESFKDFVDLELYQLGLLENFREKIIKKDLAKSISFYVQNVIQHNQNQKCVTENAILCSVSKACGFGCQMHHLMHCMTLALAKGKILIVESNSWHGFNSLYDLIQPLSTSCDKSKIIVESIEKISIIDFDTKAPFFPTAVPKNIINNVESFHSVPFIWWAGQINNYLFRFQQEIKTFLNQIITFKGPIVGIHIRRTDKIGTEANSYNVEEYMYWADLYYRKMELKGFKLDKSVYLATDEIGLVDKIRETYIGEYKIYSNDNFTKSANQERDSRTGTYGILADIYLLSQTDYLVCTFSSQVCRLAYEWMNGRDLFDASFNFKSLDEIYYFGGQQQRDFNLKWTHKFENNDTMDTKKKFNLRHNDWNGYSYIQLFDQMGYHVPSFKIKENWLTAEFKAFSNYDAAIKNKKN